jgi:cell division protein FtsZ
MPGEINLDFADVRKIMAEAGPALMAIGYGSGQERAEEAARSAIASPLLDVSINGAKGVLFNVTAGRTLGLQELNNAAQIIAEVVDPEAEIIFGTTIDPRVGDDVKITVIATGFARPSVLHSPIPEEYRRELPVDDQPTPAPAPEQPQSLEAMRTAAAADANDTELPTFLRRTVTAR